MERVVWIVGQSSIRRTNLAWRRRGRCPGGSGPNIRSLSSASRFSASAVHESQNRLPSRSDSGSRRNETPSASASPASSSPTISARPPAHQRDHVPAVFDRLNGDHGVELSAARPARWAALRFRHGPGAML
jgi:hypothetical protein